MNTTLRRSRRAAGAAGFTFTELALAMILLLVALMSMSASTLSMHDLRRQNREQVVAHTTLRAMAEEIQADAWSLRQGDPTQFVEQVVTKLSDGGDFGTSFEVRELTLPAENADGSDVESVGRIQVITDETATDAELGVQMGMPRDLDGDGVVGNTDVSSTARLLPVILRLDWRSGGRPMSAVHPFYILSY